MNPISLTWWVMSQHPFLVSLMVIVLGVVAAFLAFGGGWS